MNGVKRPTLDQLPTDVLWIIVLQGLSLVDLSRLAQTCRLLQLFVEDIGWKAYASTHHEPSPSLTPALESLKWKTGDLLRNQTLARKAWAARRFITRPLGPEWPAKYHPVLAISSSRLVVAAGNTLYVYKFTPPVRQHSEQPRIVFERAVAFTKDAKRDFTGVSFVGPEECDLLLSCANGALACVRLPQSSEAAGRRKVFAQGAAPTYLRDNGLSIRALSTSRSTALTLDSSGVASLYSLADFNSTPTSTVTVGLGAATGWSAHLTLQSRSGYAALGTASSNPLVVYPMTETGFHPTPQTTLTSSTRNTRPSAVYSICGTTQTFPSVSLSDQIIISGWYHGAVIVHDLRCPTHVPQAGMTPTLPPVLTMRDPVVLSPIYSLSSSGPHIAAGSAQHSLVHLYDVRSPKAGWSIYLPQPRRGNSSPVYSCILESTRLWAATESRPIVVDFGRGYNERTYPSLSEYPTGERSAAVGWPATFYEHDLFSRPRPHGWRSGVGSTIA